LHGKNAGVETFNTNKTFVISSTGFIFQDISHNREELKETEKPGIWRPVYIKKIAIRREK
jgi:hypothetical protein